MEGKWTFANLNIDGWVNDVYDSKEEAIAEAKKYYKNFNNKDGIVVGQLVKFSDNYYVENQDYVSFD